MLHPLRAGYDHLGSGVCVAAVLPDELVGGGQQHFRNGEAEGLAGIRFDPLIAGRLELDRPET
jgi:hypothetical protein